MRLLNKAQKKTNYTLLAFLFGCALAAVLIVPIMIMGDGYFLYYGDFNVQQIPFYLIAHDSILEGNTAWSHITDLGANFVGSYSFYNITSPFFLLTLLFKSEMVPYLFGPLLILKFGCASMTAYIYLRRYVADRKYAVLGGLLYAFSGFSIYNVFFFHFHEAIIVFPLLLAAVDEFMFTKRKGVLCLAVFTCCFMNYYFFFGQVVFVAIYWLVRVITKSYKFSFKYFLLMAFECIVGVMMACAVLIPSVLAIIGNERVSNIICGFDALVYPNQQRYIHILQSMFFPPDLPAIPNFTPDSNSKWASIALWIPMFGMTFVIGYLKTYNRSWLKRIIIILLTMAFIPILNSLFQALNDCYYARWFYIFTLMMVLCTIISLDNIREHNIKSAFTWSFVFTLSIAVGIGLMINKKYENSKAVVYSVGLEENAVRFWIYVGIAVLSLLVLMFITIFARRHRRVFFALISIMTCITIVGYSGYLLYIGKGEADQSDEFTMKYALNYGEDIKIDDIKEVRSDFYNSMDNIGMYWQIPNIQAFHSIVPYSIMDF
ncbi:MAG: YfhO family protein, partial [Ruminococcus sp.]|nr:YfhO family protein [Ruminococcus sp.]